MRRGEAEAGYSVGVRDEARQHSDEAKLVSRPKFSIPKKNIVSTILWFKLHTYIVVR